MSSRHLTNLLALVALCAACTPPSRPPIVTPAPPGARTVQITIRNAPLPAGTLSTDDGRRVECPITRLADGVPRLVCALHPDTPSGWGAHLAVTASDRMVEYVDFVLSLFDQESGPNQSLEELAMRPSRVDLPRLVRDGQFFRAGGDLWTGIETSEFNLAGRVAGGESIEAIVRQRTQDAHFNLFRVFTAYDICPDGNGCQAIGRLVPSEHPDLYSRILPAVAQEAARHGAYLELVAFTGTCYEPPRCQDNHYRVTFPGPNQADQMVAHWQGLIAVARDNSNVILELINEADHPANTGIPFDRLPRPPPPILASHGSGTMNADPVKPFWDFVTYHADEPRKVVHNCWSDWSDVYDIPCLVNETTRRPDNDDSAAHAEDQGRGCAAMIAGCAFHSAQGKASVLWTGKALDLARIWSKAARAVPLEFQRGHYVHREELEAGPAPCPCSRFYAKRLDDGREFQIPVR